MVRAADAPAAKGRQFSHRRVFFSSCQVGIRVEQFTANGLPVAQRAHTAVPPEQLGNPYACWLLRPEGLGMDCVLNGTGRVWFTALGSPWPPLPLGHLQHPEEELQAFAQLARYCASAMFSGAGAASGGGQKRARAAEAVAERSANNVPSCEASAGGTPAKRYRAQQPGAP